jgi:serine/threonine protein kinase
MPEYNAEPRGKVAGSASNDSTLRPERDSGEPTPATASPGSDRDPLEVVIEEFTQRQRRGESPSIEEYVERYPDMAAEIRELLDAVTAMERLKVRKERTPGGQASLRGVQLERLGDFRIVREIGRGGMGIVYEAIQESLGRRVAVKVLPKQALLDDKHLRRFQREAQTAGRLHHTNIVPVFGVGHHEGYHFYVMQLIEGTGLDRCEAIETAVGHLEDTKVRREDTAPEPIDQAVRSEGAAPAARAHIVAPAPGSADARAVARIGIQAADALNYAHEHQVLHRDVKPANLILDSEGTVWVTDFGLAKVLEQENVTRSGDVVGTLRYIAPEHLIGAQIDGRSDIYSLGITLYELLTGQPAFDGSSQARLIEQIVAGDIARPRQIDPEIPRDLETIVLKAIACEPEDRYQSAGDLAEDLRRFLQDKPLLARRTTAVEHVWRWCRRNRLTAALTATALSLLVLVAASASVGYVQTKAALDGEKAQRERAEAATIVGLEVLDNIFEQFAPPRFDPLHALLASGSDAQGGDESSLRPALSPDTAALLENMLTFYDRLAEQSADNKRFRQKTAQANRRIGDIRRHLGQYDQAVAAYGRALDIYRTLDDTDDIDFALHRAQIHNERGFAYPRMGQPDEAHASHLKAMEILESASPHDSAPEVRYELAQTYYRLAAAHRWNMIPPPGPSGRPRDPRDRNAEPLRHSRPPGPRLPPAHPPRQPDGAHGPPEWPPAKDPDHDFSEDSIAQREAYLRKAVDVLVELAAQPTCDPDHATFLACVYHALATLQRHSDRPDEAIANYRRAVAVQTELVARFSDNASYHVVLGWLQQPLANALRQQGELPEAQRLLESSRDTLELELAANPDLGHLHGLIAHAYFGLAEVMFELGQEAEAEQASRLADQYHRQMRPGAPHAQDRERDFGRGRPPHPRPNDRPVPFGPSGPP